MDFLFDLGLFSSKVFILVLAISIVLILFFALLARARRSKPALTVENLNEKFDHMAEALQAHVWDAKAIKGENKARKKRLKAKAKKGEGDTRRIFVLDFEGDIRATHVENLREEVTSLLTIARPGSDEVVVRLESPGGMVAPYGLAASQLVRLRSAGVQLTVCVDKVAASGGYMMACTANKIVAAPFSYIGSIGVAVEVPNFHRLLKKHDVDFQEITAGEYKRSLTMFGEVTEKGVRKVHQDVEDMHTLFKNFVSTYRPQLELPKVATGEYWCAVRAIELKLVDELSASDDYLFRQRETAQIYKVAIEARKKWSEKLAENISVLVSRTLENALVRWG